MVLTRKIVVSSIAVFVLVAIAIVVQLFLRHLLVVRFSKILLLAVI